MAIAGLFSSMATAADLYVRENGAGGSFSTISAAIAQSSNGDRIIIRPKAAGLPYIESLTIDKSLSFVSETNFSKYLLQGSVTITAAAGRMITISNLNVTGTIGFSGATTGGRTTVNINNSNLDSALNAGVANTTINMSGCTTTTVTINHGRLTGNRIGGLNVTGTAIESNPTDYNLEILGNLFGTDVVITERNYALKFNNNYMTNNSRLYISGVKTNSSNEIRNNVINYSASLSALVITLGTGNTATFFVLNNVITSSSTASNYGEIAVADGTSTVYAMYNASNSAFTTVGPMVASNNLSALTLSFNNGTGTVSGTGLVNAGAADDDYADIDLTRNDIGNAGGSDSWSNYWPANVGNKPQVNYLLTPRRIYTGTTEMEAQGSGFSK